MLVVTQSVEHAMLGYPFQLDLAFIAKLWERLSRFLVGRDSQAYGSLLPTIEQLTEVCQAAFWASLQKQESRPVTFSLAFIPPDESPNAFTFERAAYLNPESIARLAPALHDSKSVIGVWPEDGQLVIWGFTSGTAMSTSGSLPYWFVDPNMGWPLTIQVQEPGKLIVRAQHRAVALVSCRRVAFLEEQDRIWETALWSKIPLGLDSLIGQEEHRLQIFQSLFKIAQAARAHGRGGMLLVVPEDEEWKNSVQHPILYSGRAPFDCARTCLSQYVSGYESPLSQQGDIVDHILSPENIETYQLLNQSLDAIGQLTAVDGATVLTYGLRVLAFGVKVRPIHAERRPDRVRLTEPIEGARAKIIAVAELGNTRHQSAAQFVFDQKGAIAFVVSQDEKITLMTWDDGLQVITAVGHAELLFN
jgi:hypothetical protein